MPSDVPNACIGRQPAEVKPGPDQERYIATTALSYLNYDIEYLSQGKQWTHTANAA